MPGTARCASEWQHSITTIYQFAMIAAALEGENYQEALEGFEKVVALENNDKGEWCGCTRSRCDSCSLGMRCISTTVAVRSDTFTPDCKYCIDVMAFISRRGFKAYKQIVKVQYRLGNTDAMLDAYR